MIEQEFNGTKSSFYHTTAEVARVVNLAIALGRPLLVEGEPGSGKTKLADAVAEELGLGAPIKVVVKSTHQARDLLYRFDPLRRLQDAQISGRSGEGGPSGEGGDPGRNARFIWPYITLGPLGKAIHQGKREVVLIDEIDKADIDFPNDLLEVLEDLSFQIEDLPQDEDELSRAGNGFGRSVGGTVDRKLRPVVIITSNREKPLPDPFLRRCLFVRLDFPSTVEQLQEIARLNLKADGTAAQTPLVDAAVDAFIRVRETARAGDVRRLPSTSELVDWIKILHWSGTRAEAVANSLELPPYWDTLFKTHFDQAGYRAAAGKEQL